MILKKNSRIIKHSQTLESKNLQIKKFQSFEENLFKKVQNKRKISFLYDQESTNITKTNLNTSELIKKTCTTKNINNTFDSIDYNKIHEKEMIHTYFKQPEIKFLKPKKINPIKIILKKNCIENVIERNKMDSHRNKTLDEIKKDIIDNYKNHHSQFQTSFITENNDNYSNEYFFLKKHSENIPSIKLKNSIITNKEKRFNSDLLENNLLNNVFTKDNLPSIKEKLFNKKQLKKIGEEKANKILKAIRNMSCKEYEILDKSKETINRNNLNRIIELMSIIKLKKYDIENEFGELSYNPNSYEGNYVTKLIYNLGPLRLIKQNFKNTTIQKFNNSKGTGFGVPRYHEDIKENVKHLKYK